MRTFFLLVALLCAGSAHAKDNTGRIGIGADTTLGYFSESNFQDGRLEPGGFGVMKVPGVSLIYQTSKLFGIQVILATNITSGTLAAGPVEVRTRVSEVAVGVRGIINIALTDDVNLGLPVGVTVINRQSSIEDVDGYVADRYGAFEVGIRPEWFISNWFSIHTQVGLALSIVPADPDDTDNQVINPFTGGATAVDLLGASNLLGQAGFTFYF
ncbi:MAG: hypothetical protein EP330_22390 [Deltaproteobacteria bacterium]|nr:MAG: hypothetical protein EP330_22390 [Deltaproteobacteria bacterium]